MQTVQRWITLVNLNRLSDKAFGLPQMGWERAVLISIAIIPWLYAAEVQAQQSESLQRFSDTAAKFWNKSKALGKTDSFNIRTAFKRAVQKEETGIPFRWNNTHTKNYGEIVLLSFTNPLGSCVNYKHAYYARGSSASIDRGTVCKDSQGTWNDIAIPAVFQGVGGANQNSEQQPREKKIVREVQDLLYQLKYDPGPIDGRQGPKTRRAIEQYQRDVDLPITGQVSTELVKALKQSVSATTQPQLVSIEEISNTESLNVPSSLDTAQPVISVLPDITEVEIASDTKASSEQTSVTSIEADGLDTQGYVANEKTDISTVNQGAVTPIEMNTGIIAVDKQQIGSSVDQVETGPTNITGLTKFSSVVTGVSVFPWFNAILGFVFFSIIALFLSRLVVPKRSRPAALQGLSDQVTVTAQGAISDESTVDSSQTLASTRNNRLYDGQQNEGTRVHRTVNGAAESVNRPQPAPGLVMEDGRDTILIAITEFDDIIKETEGVLSQTFIDRDTRSYIVEAVEIARSMMTKTLSGDLTGGDDHDQTAKAIEDATKLIKDALDTCPREVANISA